MNARLTGLRDFMLLFFFIDLGAKLDFSTLGGEIVPAAGVEATGVDFDPEAVRTLRRQRLPVRFGDGEDPDFVASLPLAQARWVITTFPQWESNRALLHALQAAQFNGSIVGAVRDMAHGRALEAAGVAYILNPCDDAADHAARRLATQIHTPKDLT